MGQDTKITDLEVEIQEDFEFHFCTDEYGTWQRIFKLISYIAQHGLPDQVLEDDDHFYCVYTIDSSTDRVYRSYTHSICFCKPFRAEFIGD